MRAVLLIALLSSGPVAAADPSYLDQARVLYEALEYELCLQQLERAVETQRSPRELADIQLYLALCSHGLGAEEDAREHLRLALRLDPAIRPPDWVSPKVRAFFEEVHRSLPPEPAAPPPDAPVAAELTPAPVTPPPQLVEQPQTVSAVRVRPLTWALGGTAAGVGAAGVIFGVLAQSSERAFHASTFESERAQLRGQAQQRALIANVAFGIAATAAVGTVVSLFWPADPPAAAPAQ